MKRGSEWTSRDDDLLLEFVLGGGADTDVFAIAGCLRREPLGVLQRIRDGELASMLGFELGPGSDEECEFFGLALSGVPLQAALRWCTVADDRPTSTQLEALLGERGDLRPGMNLVRELGLWFTEAKQAEDLIALCKLSRDEVRDATASVLSRYDAPTPTMVLAQVRGQCLADRPPTPYPWFDPAAPVRTSSRRRGSTNRRAGTYRKRRRSRSTPPSAGASPSKRRVRQYGRTGS